MEINLFNDASQVPQPKHKVRIEAFSASVYPDRFRVKVSISLTPFQERPNMAITARRSDGLEVSDLDVIATMHYDNEFTMHIRGLDDPTGDYSLSAELYYETRDPPQDQAPNPIHDSAGDKLKVAMSIAYGVAREIADHALADAPREVCGILGGRGDNITKCISVSNAAAAPESQFKLDPNEQLNALKALDELGLTWLGVYHSHPKSPPIPSESDIDAAADGALLHLIVSLEGRKPRLKLWRIEDHSVRPVELVFDTEAVEARDAPLSRMQQMALVAVGAAALLLLLIIAFSLLPPAPDLASGR